MGILSFIFENKNFFCLLFTSFLCVAGIVLYGIRAGDFKALLDRVWRILAGSETDSKCVVDEFVGETRSIERIKFVYGIRARSNRDLIKLKYWIDSNNLTMKTVQGCSNYINLVDGVSVNRPSGFVAFTLIACLVLFYFLLHGFAYLSALNEAPIRTKETGVFAWVSESQIRSFYFSNKEWSFGVKDCSNERRHLTYITGFNKTEVDVLCNDLGTDSWKTSLIQDLRIQHIFGLIGFYFVIYFL